MTPKMERLIYDYEMKYQVRIELIGNLKALEKALEEHREIANEEFQEMGFPIPKKKLQAPHWRMLTDEELRQIKEKNDL